MELSFRIHPPPLTHQLIIELHLLTLYHPPWQQIYCFHFVKYYYLYHLAEHLP